MEEDRKALRGEFDEAVNMTTASPSATNRAGKSWIKRKTVDELTDDDYAHLRKVVGFVRRHEAQGGPERDVEHSPWRYLLMNWGRDPLK